MNAEAGFLDVSHERGFYTNSFNLVLSSDDPSTTIRYSLTKEKPDGTSLPYTAPIPITTTSFVRVYASNGVEEHHETHTYIFPADVWSQPDMSGHIGQAPDYASRLIPSLLAIPSVSLVSVNINGEEPVDSVLETSVEIFSPDGSLSLQEHCGTKTWGGSPSNPKKSYRLEFKREYGPGKLHAPGLFDDGFKKRIPAAFSFDHLLLRAGSQDGLNGEFGNETHASFLRNRVAFDMEIELGNVAPQGRFVHVYLNGSYHGQYHLLERVNGGWMEEYFGGEKEDYDIRKDLEYVDGDEAFYNQMLEKAASHTTTAEYTELRRYLNTKRMADYLVLGSFVGTFDFNANHNSLAAADRTPGNGGYEFMMWDKDLALHNPGSFMVEVVDTIQIKYGPSPAALGQSAEFQFELVDSVWCSMMENDAPIRVDRAKEIWNTRADQIRLPLVAEAARWGNREFTYLRNTDVPNWNPDEHWEVEIAEVDNWLNWRTGDVLAFHQENGSVPALQGVRFTDPANVVLPADHIITVINPNGTGTVYQARDGKDPRGFGGSFSGDQIASNTIALDGRAHKVWARVLAGQTWSPGCEKIFYAEQNWADLVITEIQYHSSTNHCGGEANKDTEFIELSNRGSSTLDLSGAAFTKGVSFRFPFGTLLAPGEFLVLAENEEAFAELHGEPPFGEYGGKLDDNGETLVLRDPDNREVFSLRYNDGSSWPQAPDGNGPSLELLDVQLDGNEGWAWQASSQHCGTPGTGAPPCPAPVEQVVINEVMYKPDLSGDFDGLKVGDWLELYNHGFWPVDVSGWELVHGTNHFTLSDGSIPPRGFAVVSASEQSWSGYPGVQAVITVDNLLIDNGGDFFTLWNAEGCLVDAFEYDDKEPWPVEPDQNGSSLSLLNPLADNADPANWRASGNVLGTPGQPNQVGLCGGVMPSLVINEINYDSSLEADAGDWIEFHNLDNVAYSLDGWRFVDGNSVYLFPPGIDIAPNGYLVLAEDPALFGNRFPDVSTVGPIGFSLSNGGEIIGLFTSEGCLVDKVTYDDDLPWEFGADGTGPTLSLIDPGFDNELPWSWALSTIVPGAEHGTPGAPNGIPAPCSPPPKTVIITELNIDSTPFVDVGDWIELYNPGPDMINVSNWRLYDEQSRIDLPPFTILMPDSYLVLAEDVFRFQEQFPDVIPLNGNGSTFRSAGEHLQLRTPTGCLVDELHYDAETWPRQGIGYGPTLQLDQSDVIGADNAHPALWSTSNGIGTPGKANQTLVCTDPSPNLVINEIATAGPAGSWLELFNPTAEAMDLSGFQIGISTNVFFIPSNTTIAAGGFVVLAAEHDQFAAQFPGVSVGPLGASLSSPPHGIETITLYTPTHCPVGIVTYGGQDWPTPGPDGAIGLLAPTYDEAAPESWTTSAPATPGAPNQSENIIGVVVTGPDHVPAMENQVLTFSLAPGDLTYAIQPAPPDGMTITNGVVSWTPDESMGGHILSLECIGTKTEGDVTTLGSKIITIPIEETNEAPILANLASATLPETQPWSLPLEIRDPDLPAQPLSLTLEDAAPGMTLEGSVLSWTPSESQGGADYPVTLRLSDGITEVTQTVTLAVAEINVPPVINFPGNALINEVEPWSLPIHVTDPDSPEALTYSVTGPPGLTINANGLVSWTPTEAQGPGTYSINVTVTDSSDTSDSETFTVAVAEVNATPQFTAPPFNTNLTARELWMFQFTTEDDDQDPLTLEILSGPDGLVLDPDTGWLRWLPGQSGAYPVSLKVSDPGGLEDTMDFTLSVQDVLVPNFADLPCSDEETLVLPGSTWTWSIDEPGNQWREPWFTPNDGAGTWSEGAAILGYGEDGLSTLTTPSQIRTLFIQTFVVTNISTITALTARVMRDDGAVLYLNGEEVARDNLPEGTIHEDTRATTSTFGSNETIYHLLPLDPSRLAQGLNTLSVAVHQISPSSNDMRFDCELVAGRAKACPDDPPEHQPIQIDETHFLATGEIQFNSIPGLTYIIESCGTLDQGEWTTSATLSADGPSTSYTPQFDTPRKAFRVKCLP